MGTSSVGAGKSKAGAEMPAVFQQMITEFWEGTKEIRETYQSQMQEMLTTGGAGARIPIVQRAEEAQRRASSQALGDVSEQLALKGLAGTPIGENTLAQTIQQGRSAVAGVGPGMAAQWLQGVPGYILGQAQSAMGATGGTRETEAQAKSWM